MVHTSTLDNSTLNHRDCAQFHKENRLETNQAQNSVEFKDQIKYELPLDDIYEVKCSCLYDDAEKYCPVIVKIKDESLIKMNGKLPFLLQIWNRKGELIFERSLAH